MTLGTRRLPTALLALALLAPGALAQDRAPYQVKILRATALELSDGGAPRSDGCLPGITATRDLPKGDPSDDDSPRSFRSLRYSGYHPQLYSDKIILNFSGLEARNHRIAWAGVIRTPPRKSGPLWIGYLDGLWRPREAYDALILYEMGSGQYQLARVSAIAYGSGWDRCKAKLQDIGFDEVRGLPPATVLDAGGLDARRRTTFDVDWGKLAGVEDSEVVPPPYERPLVPRRSGPGEFRLVRPYWVMLRPKEAGFAGTVEVLADGEPVGSQALVGRGPVDCVLTPVADARPLEEARLEVRVATKEGDGPSGTAPATFTRKVPSAGTLDFALVRSVPTSVQLVSRDGSRAPAGLNQVRLKVDGQSQLVDLEGGTARLDLGEQPADATPGQLLEIEAGPWALGPSRKRPGDGPGAWEQELRPAPVKLYHACRLGPGEELPPERWLPLGFRAEGGAAYQVKLQGSKRPDDAFQGAHLLGTRPVNELGEPVLKSLAQRDKETEQRWRIESTRLELPPIGPDASSLLQAEPAALVVTTLRPAQQTIAIPWPERPAAGDWLPYACSLTGTGQDARFADKSLAELVQLTTNPLVEVDWWREPELALHLGGQDAGRLGVGGPDAALLPKPPALGAREVRLQVALRDRKGATERFTASELKSYSLHWGVALGTLEGSHEEDGHRQRVFRALVTSGRLAAPGSPELRTAAGAGPPPQQTRTDAAILYTWDVPSDRLDCVVRARDLPFPFDLRLRDGEGHWDVPLRPGPSGAAELPLRLPRGMLEDNLRDPLRPIVPAGKRVAAPGLDGALRARITRLGAGDGFAIDGYEVVGPEVLLVLSNDKQMERRGSDKVAYQAVTQAISAADRVRGGQAVPRFHLLTLARTSNAIDHAPGGPGARWKPEGIRSLSDRDATTGSLARDGLQFYSTLGTHGDVDLPTVLQAVAAHGRDSRAEGFRALVILNSIPRNLRLPLDVVDWLGPRAQAPEVKLLLLGPVAPAAEWSVQYDDRGGQERVVPLRDLVQVVPIDPGRQDLSQVLEAELYAPWK